MTSVTRPTSYFFLSNILSTRSQLLHHKHSLTRACFSEEVMGLSSQVGLLEQNATVWVMTRQTFVSTDLEAGKSKNKEPTGLPYGEGSAFWSVDSCLLTGCSPGLS